MPRSMRLQRIRDPLYNLIEFREESVDYLLWQIIQTEAFQRLRRIKQLGFSEFVYPGATHTRFAHSLGVFHLARRLIEIIDVKLKKRGSPTSNNAQKDAALCAALLHDLGHGPFSHAFEEVGKKFQLASVNHETITDKLIRNGEIGDILDRYYKGFSSNVADAIGEHSDIYSSVVSGQFDADRLDYMQRDRMMTGTNTGNVDLEWLFSNIEIEEVEFSADEENVYKADAMVLNPKGLLAAEAYALNLFQLYPTVYYHKTTRCMEKIFTELMYLLISKIRDTANKGLRISAEHPICKFVKDGCSWQSSLLLNDTVIWGMLEQLRDADDKNVSELSDRLYNRKLFKSIKMPIKDVLIKNNIKKKEQDKEEIVKRFFNKAYPDLLSDVKNWNDEHPNVNDKIFMDMVQRSSYNNPKANRNRSNQILAVNEKQRIVSLTDISDVARSIGPFIEIRGYISEYGNNAERYLKDIVENYRMKEVALCS